MSEILLCRTKSLQDRTKRQLSKAGVLVVEVDDPSQVRFIQPTSLVGSDDLLFAALKAMEPQKGDYSSDGSKQRERFTMHVLKLVELARGDSEPVKEPTQ